MAATGKTPILLYGSTTTSNVPAAGNLTNSSDGCEIAINVADGKLFYKDTGNAVQVIASKDAASGSFTSLTDSGNLTFTGTGNRITGDMSNATVANRVLFQTSTTNGNTTIAAIPNGTASITALRAYGSSDPANASLLGVQCQNGTIASILSDKTGTGTYVPLAFYTSGTKQLQIETTGNVTLQTGNLVIGTSGKGIDFSATAGTGTSELLADYEEGTWTPTVTATAGAITSYTSSGTYTKTGRCVVLNFKFTITNNGTGATSIDLTNLPFATAGTNNAFGCCGDQGMTGEMGQCLTVGTDKIRIVKYNFTYLGGTGYIIVGTITYTT